MSAEHLGSAGIAFLPMGILEEDGPGCPRSGAVSFVHYSEE
jgi:hypothetical protein